MRGYDEDFQAADEKKLEMEDMMAKMKAETGMGMKVPLSTLLFYTFIFDNSLRSQLRTRSLLPVLLS